MSERAGDLPIDAGALAPDAVSRILDIRDARLRAWGRPAAAPADAVAVLAARLGTATVAIPLDRLAAVAAPVVARALPGAPPALAGLFAHRARLHSLLLIDIALGLPPPAAGRTVALVLRGDVRPLAIAVDAALGVTRAVPDAAGSRYADTPDHRTVLMVDMDTVLRSIGVAPVAGEEG